MGRLPVETYWAMHRQQYGVLHAQTLIPWPRAPGELARVEQRWHHWAEESGLGCPVCDLDDAEADA